MRVFKKCLEKWGTFRYISTALKCGGQSKYDYNCDIIIFIVICNRKTPDICQNPKVGARSAHASDPYSKSLVFCIKKKKN